MNDESCNVTIERESDVARVVVQAQRMAQSQGFYRTPSFLVATAVSELARNMFLYAGGGNIVLRPLSDDGRPGLEVVAEDEGPGIADIELALTDGYSTGQSLGLGLPGVRRIMDELEFEADRATGTKITARKWR